MLLENLLRHEDGLSVARDDIQALARWRPDQKPDKEIQFMPSRVLLQDFTGVPAVADLAAMRDAIAALGGDPQKINPLQQSDLVIDHSVQVDSYGLRDAFRLNAEKEFKRNQERYKFLCWGQKAFNNFRVVPPDTGIVHQVNLEYLASVVYSRRTPEGLTAYPDTLVGTDSHTTMISGLGVLGWGVGGIEAEAAMLGQPIAMLAPPVVGFKLTGALAEGATATDLVLTVTQMLREKGVVGKIVEFYGAGLSALALTDRATLANMAPEYGATTGFFPVDDETLNYLRQTGRDPKQIRLVKAYLKEQGLFRTDDAPVPLYSDSLELDLSRVEPSLAGPRRPQDRVPLRNSKPEFEKALGAFWPKQTAATPAAAKVPVQMNGQRFELGHGSVVIASITSCTNTSNPQVMLQAGLLAQKAARAGLKSKPWVKTSLAPGSKVVMDYLQKSKLLPALESLGFYLVGYGCTTCIGNSGPLPDAVEKAIQAANLVAACVLSGNRNFEGRIHPSVRASYLASPPLVVAYALAGRMDIDLYREPLGHDASGKPVFLKDIWPSQKEVRLAVQKFIKKEMFHKQYGKIFQGDKRWKTLRVPGGSRFAWSKDSTYIKKPPFFAGMTREPEKPRPIAAARVLALLGDSVTTDHISPAGNIPADGPAGRYLIKQGVEKKDFNSFGARRGNHEVMLRGAFSNIRLRNLLAPGTEGGWTRRLPDGEVMTIYDAAMSYAKEKTDLLILAGKEYGSGSSRDWAAKGAALLGVRAVIAESYERIHRSNLVGMGILPLQFKLGENCRSLGLTGEETFDIENVAEDFKPGREMEIACLAPGGGKNRFKVLCRIDTPKELEYYRHGGILKYALRQLL